VRYVDSEYLFESPVLHPQCFSGSGEGYWTVTFTTVEIVAAPEVPVTVKEVAPAGVPGVPGVLEL
jgi:hypothetical protein